MAQKVLIIDDEPGVLDSVFYLKPAWAGWEPEHLLHLLTTMHDADPEGVSWTSSSCACSSNPGPSSSSTCATS